MEFQEISQHASSVAFVATFVLLFIAFGIIFVSLSDLPDSSKKRTLVRLVAIAVLIAATFGTSRWDDATQEANAQALISNIEQKYNVDEVILETADNKTEPATTESQSVSVLVDDVTYRFHLTQDADTWEPTLSNPPVNGGSSEVVNLSAQDLLK